jgi:cell division septation protein DedD
MDKQKTQRIIGILVIVAFVIVLIPLFFGKTDMSTELTNNKVLPVPGQQTETTTLAKTDINDGQTPDDSVILGPTTISNNSTTDSQTIPNPTDNGQTNTSNTSEAATMNADDSVVNVKNNMDQGQVDHSSSEQPSPINATSNPQKNAESTVSEEDQDGSIINITSEVANQINSKTEPGRTEISKADIPSQSETTSQTETLSKTPPLSVEAQPSLSNNDQSSLEQPKADALPAKNIVSEPSASPKVKKHKTMTAEKKRSSKVRPVNLTNRELEKLNSTAWAVQMGNFKDKNNARRLADKLRNAGYKAFTKEIKSAKGSISTRVYIGPEFKQTAALQISNKVEQDMKMHGIVVSIKPLEI